METAVAKTVVAGFSLGRAEVLRRDVFKAFPRN